jgi:iron only hydrogenase large subunit-like protein/uncharacterized Fe-S cluster-containing protein
VREYLKLKKSNCKNCYKCIRHCPVKSIQFSNNQAHIVSDECILCGHCFVACPQNAKEISDDVPAAEELIRGGAPVYASVAPSFVANYEGITIGAMEKALKRLGFAEVEETAIGATIVKNRYDQMLRREDQNLIISTCCHSVNLLMQKYYPAALPFAAHVVSPMQAHSLDIKRRFPEAKTVFIGPCISKKAEAETCGGIVDCVLTFEELSAWLKQKNIDLSPLEEERKERSLARFFPTAGGILRTMAKENPRYTYLAIDGIDNCIASLEDVVSGKLEKCFIEMSACAGSCIGGPVMNKSRAAPVRDYIRVSRYAGAEDFELSASYTENDLKKSMNPLTPRRVHLGDDAIKEVLQKMGKTRPEHELNCGSCGYNTCRDKARAVLEGKATLTMCLPYLKEKAESFSDDIIKNTPNAIIVLNENLEVQQINTAACRLLNIRDPHNILGDQVVRILDPLPFFEVSQRGENIYNKRSYLADYQKAVDQSIIYDKSYHIVICIMRDVTEESARREAKKAFNQKAIEITDKVIEKQMRAVQEIASLLGETTAETKIALTKLKESLADE